MTGPGKRTASAAEPPGATDGPRPAVLAEFEMRHLHCRIVPVDGNASAETPGNGTDSGELGRIELDGRRYRVLAQPRAAAEAGTDPDPTRVLTTREIEIVRLVCHGHVNKRIADRLRISEYTVKTYLKQIFIKLGVRSRAAMVFRCASAMAPEIDPGRPASYRR
jgi:DNA-binding CsgD family transcriptional regulator